MLALSVAVVYFDEGAVFLSSLLLCLFSAEGTIIAILSDADDPQWRLVASLVIRWPNLYWRVVCR